MAAAGKGLAEKRLLDPAGSWGASPSAFWCWVLAAPLCAADPGSLLGAAEMGLISLACGVKGWLMSLAGLQDGSGCRMGTAQAAPVEPEDGWQPESVSSPTPNPMGAGSAGCSAAPAQAVGEDCSGSEGLRPPFLWRETQFV